MPNLKMAKRAVAVQACKMLYENEELNEDLKPFNKIKCLNNIHSLYFSHWNSPEFAKGINHHQYFSLIKDQRYPLLRYHPN